MSEASSRPHVIAIVGPTAVGKSFVADEIARRIGGEVVSADSMQIYRGMDIGTAKTPLGERGVPYHCLDLVEPGTPYAAALFQRDARAAIEESAGRGHTPVVAGGTGLYVRAALDEMDFPSGETTTAVRERLEAELSAGGSDALHKQLEAVDPASAALIHPNNARRTVRALEMLEVDGVSYADQAAGFRERRPHYPTIYVGLDMERAQLYRRIDERVDTMLRAGLLDEVRGLLAQGFRAALTASQAIGYKELVPVLEDEADLDGAVAAIKQASRRYAKRQLTWFRADPRVQWLDVTESSPAQAIKAVFALLESGGPPRSE